MITGTHGHIGFGSEMPGRRAMTGITRISSPSAGAARSGKSAACWATRSSCWRSGTRTRNFGIAIPGFATGPRLGILAMPSLTKGEQVLPDSANRIAGRAQQEFHSFAMPGKNRVLRQIVGKAGFCGAETVAPSLQARSSNARKIRSPWNWRCALANGKSPWRLYVALAQHSLLFNRGESIEDPTKTSETPDIPSFRSRMKLRGPFIAGWQARPKSLAYGSSPIRLHLYFV